MEVMEGLFTWFSWVFDMLFSTPFPFFGISWGIFLVGMFVLNLSVGFIAGLLPSSSNERTDK